MSYRSRRTLGYILLLAGIAFFACCLKYSSMGRLLVLPGPTPQGRITYVLLHDGKVVMLQPDNSLTILDAETGELLLRGKSVMPVYSDDQLQLGAGGYGFTLVPYGKILLATSWGQDFLLKMDDGELIASGWFFDQGGMETEANHLFAVSPKDHDVSFVYSLDMNNGRILWKKEIAGRWHNLFIAENNLYLFKIGPDDKCSAVLDKNGAFLDMTATPPAPLHNAEAERLANMSKATSDTPDDRYIKELLGDRLYRRLGGFRLPDGGAAAISTSSFAEQPAVLHFNDGNGVKWERQLNSSRNLEFYFLHWSLAADDRVVVYAGNYGRIECIDRATGRSRWLYGFPRKNMGKWDKHHPPVLLRFSIANWTQYQSASMEQPSGLYEKASRFLGALCRHWGKDFYTDDRKEFDEDMQVSNMAGVTAPGEAASTPKLVLDSKVAEFDAFSIWLAKIANWSAVAISACALFIAWQADTEPSTKIRLLALVMVLSSLVLFLFGRYDRLCFQILWYSALGAYMLFAHTLIRHSAANSAES